MGRAGRPGRAARALAAVLGLAVWAAGAEARAEKAQEGEPSEYEKARDLALAHVQAGSLEKARELILRTLRTRDTAELRSLLGNLEEEAGNLLAAAEEFQRAAHMDPTEERLFDWGNNLLRLRAYPQAERVFGAAVERFPGSARLQVGLGIARYSRGQYQEAVRSFCAAADLDPSDPRPYVFLGEMYGVSPELADEVSRRLAHLLRTHPENALGHYHYAMSLWKGRPDPAVPVDLGQVERSLKTAAALDPKLAQAHFRLGVLHFDQGRYEEAEEAFREAVRVAPDLAEAHYRLGQLYLRTGRKALAERELDAFRTLSERQAEPAAPR
ncbi:MAG TPA: tetratricopeptide repeat protein [Vicinamibacteria bacterium]|nr:tetratricopeptide repeat protein [Vicinamibacteria bacterium]